MGCKIAVSEPEPGGPTEARDLLQEAPGLVSNAPTGFRVGDAAQRVHHGIEVGRYGQAEMLEVIGRVDDDCQPAAQHRGKPVGKLCPADASRQCNDHEGSPYLKRSWSLGRMISAALPSRRS